MALYQKRHFLGKTMDLKNVIDNYLSGLSGGRKFRQRNKMGGFRKAIYNRENNLVTLGGRKPCDKIKGNLCPRARRNG